MPLSKARDKERKRLSRLDKRLEMQDVQPKPTIPLYNPLLHRAGDKVMVYKGMQLIETVIPELDGDGNAIPVY